MTGESISLTYRIVMACATPVVRWWGRLEVAGLDDVPPAGAMLLIANHDSMWDPLVAGVAALPRRQIRALAKSSLWKYRPVAWVLNHMGQIPIDRGRGDVQALAAAIGQLEAGACIGVFPEGTISRGKVLRPLSGAGRLAATVPNTQVVCAAITGVVDIVRFPKRPRLRVEFFAPSGGPRGEDESAVALTKRTMTEIRAKAPQAIPGRRKKAAALRADLDA